MRTLPTLYPAQERALKRVINEPRLVYVSDPFERPRRCIMVMWLYRLAEDEFLFEACRTDLAGLKFMKRDVKWALARLHRRCRRLFT